MLTGNIKIIVPWLDITTTAENTVHQTSRQQSNYNHNKITKPTFQALVVPSNIKNDVKAERQITLRNSYCTKRFQNVVCGFRRSLYFIRYYERSDWLT